MAMTGHNSPQVPYESTALPMGVSMRLRSFRMGSNVPSAVVVSAMTTASPSMPSSENSGHAHTAKTAIANVKIQVTNPRFP